MRVFAIADLHLPGGQDKPMDIFGLNWTDHWEKIKSNWSSTIKEEDIVLIPGDISWAMYLEDALADIMKIHELPGRKFLIKGNHDYWWSSLTKLRNVSPDSINYIQNNSFELDFDGKKLALCGSRGWADPESKDFSKEDKKIFDRELHRLRLSLDSAGDVDEIIVMLHFPPFNDRGEGNELTKVLEGYPVSHLVFGHLHGESLRRVFEGPIDGINYHLVSCDYLDFKPKLIRVL